ncbi:MAG: alpha-L-fucosidase [Clostridia bacterium]|nr:alpha-L-fucosidase [Clostridia bacterium]
MVEIFEKYGLKPYGKTPNPRQLAHMKMEKKAFIHFGVNTFTGKEWGLGDEIESLFNPTELDTHQWARVARDAGCKIVILTAKHHDGFCLWPSAYTEHTVAKSPYKNGRGDVVREFADACREYGLLVGIYISPWDRSVKEWGTPDYNTFYNNQLTELLTNYGRIDEVWWDGAGSDEVEYDWELWLNTVRTLQPTAAIFGGTEYTADLRWVGNEKGTAGTTHYASIEMDCMTGYPAEKLNTGHQGGSRYLFSETDVSIRPGWFYHKSQDAFVKTPSVLDNIWFTSVARNSNLLLNFPPDSRGLIYEADAEYSRISNENIEKMRSVNLAHGAQLTADSTLADELSVSNLLDGSYGTFYMSAKDTVTATVDIILPEKREINVIAISEVVELGERINSFTLESLDDGAHILCEGTSVGYYRAIKFDTGAHRHLRLTLRGVDSIALRALALHFYEAPSYVENDAAYDINLVEQHGGGVALSDGNRVATLAFGGIFEFNTVRATLAEPAEYRLEVFDGTSFIHRTSGKTDGNELRIRLDEVESGSYQIKLIATAPFAENSEFTVTKEK